MNGTTMRTWLMKERFSKDHIELFSTPALSATVIRESERPGDPGSSPEGFGSCLT